MATTETPLTRWAGRVTTGEIDQTYTNIMARDANEAFEKARKAFVKDWVAPYTGGPIREGEVHITRAFVPYKEEDWPFLEEK